MKDIILKAVPDAVIEEKQKLTVTVEPKQLHPLIKALYSNKELPFDYLINLIGMDWGEKLGVMYLLSSSADMSREVVIITSTDDRQNPLLYSITDMYEAAHLNEREVYAMFGIRFINNPDMRRFLLDDDAFRARIVGTFSARGVDASRLTFFPRLPTAAYLARYGDIDIALDAFPCAGATTVEDVPAWIVNNEPLMRILISNALTGHIPVDEQRLIARYLHKPNEPMQ